jgi:hypothetical protein
MVRVMAKTTQAATMAVGVVIGTLMSATPVAASPPAPAPTTDQKQTLFIQYLTDHGVPFTSRPQALKLAQTTCAHLGSGSSTSLQDAVTAIQNSITMRPEQVQQFAGASRAVFCPDTKIS